MKKQNLRDVMYLAQSNNYRAPGTQGSEHLAQGCSQGEPCLWYLDGVEKNLEASEEGSQEPILGLLGKIQVTQLNLSFI